MLTKQRIYFLCEIDYFSEWLWEVSRIIRHSGTSPWNAREIFRLKDVQTKKIKVTQLYHNIRPNLPENQWVLMKINDFWWKSMILGQFWGHFWAKVHKIINQWNERCTVVVWVLYATWIISECSGASNMVIPSSWHLISCRTAQIPLGARHPTFGWGRVEEKREERRVWGARSAPKWCGDAGRGVGARVVGWEGVYGVQKRL